MPPLSPSPTPARSCSAKGAAHQRSAPCKRAVDLLLALARFMHESPSYKCTCVRGAGHQRGGRAGEGRSKLGEKGPGRLQLQRRRVWTRCIHTAQRRLCDRRRRQRDASALAEFGPGQCASGIETRRGRRRFAIRHGSGTHSSDGGLVAERTGEGVGHLLFSLAPFVGPGRPRARVTIISTLTPGSQLWRAAASGQTAEVARLVAAGADVRSCDPHEVRHRRAEGGACIRSNGRRRCRIHRAWGGGVQSYALMDGAAAAAASDEPPCCLTRTCGRVRSAGREGRGAEGRRRRAYRHGARAGAAAGGRQRCGQGGRSARCRARESQRPPREGAPLSCWSPVCGCVHTRRVN